MGATLMNMVQCVGKYVHVFLLSRIVLSGDEGHLADCGRHCFFPDLDLDGRSILSECCIHVTHGNIHFQAG